MKVIIADDHQLIINGLQSVLTEKYPQVEVDGAINKSILYELLATNKYDVLIQDLKFGADNAKDFLKEIKSEYPSLKIIVLSSISDSVTIKQLSNLVDGYVIKSESLEELTNAISKVTNGEKYFSELASNRLKENSVDEIILTRREKEVLQVTLQEKSIKEIADILCISEKTVELHRSNLFVKLDVKNITGLVKKAIALNLIEE